jgi:hypothetical protein
MDASVRTVAVVVIALLGCACVGPFSEMQEQQYPNTAAAKAADPSGWIPPILTDDATSIRELHDVDSGSRNRLLARHARPQRFESASMAPPGRYVSIASHDNPVPPTREAGPLADVRCRAKTVQCPFRDRIRVTAVAEFDCSHVRRRFAPITQSAPPCIPACS